VVENQFSVLNSLWFTIGAFMQQGKDNWYILIMESTIIYQSNGNRWFFFFALPWSFLIKTMNELKKKPFSIQHLPKRS
jgi:hypothetical protein